MFRTCHSWEKNVKISTSLLACVWAACAMSAMAQDGSKPPSNRAGIDIVDLIARQARVSGKQFIVDPRVRGEATLAGLDPAKLSHEQLLAILDLHQFTVIEAGGVLAVVPDAAARQLPSPTYSNLDFKALDHELVTLLVQPKNVCAAFLVPVLRPLMPQPGHLAADVQTNVLIINDRAGNVRRIADLVEQLDRRGKGNKDCPSPGFHSSSGASPGKSAS
jgi:general secretion pathway protein D